MFQYKRLFGLCSHSLCVFCGAGSQWVSLTLSGLDVSRRFLKDYWYIDKVGGFVTGVPQEKSLWCRVDKLNGFRLFGSQNRKVHFVCSFSECMGMVHEKAELYHLFVFFVLIRVQGDKEVVVTFSEWLGLYYACSSITSIDLLMNSDGDYPARSVF